MQCAAHLQYIGVGKPLRQHPRHLLLLGVGGVTQHGEPLGLLPRLALLLRPLSLLLLGLLLDLNRLILLGILYLPFLLQFLVYIIQQSLFSSCVLASLVFRVEPVHLEEVLLLLLVQLLPLILDVRHLFSANSLNSQTSPSMEEEKLSL